MLKASQSAFFWYFVAYLVLLRAGLLAGYWQHAKRVFQVSNNRFDQVPLYAKQWVEAQITCTIYWLLVLCFTLCMLCSIQTWWELQLRPMQLCLYVLPSGLHCRCKLRIITSLMWDDCVSQSWLLCCIWETSRLETQSGIDQQQVQKLSNFSAESWHGCLFRREFALWNLGCRS